VDLSHSFLAVLRWHAEALQFCTVRRVTRRSMSSIHPCMPGGGVSAARARTGDARATACRRYLFLSQIHRPFAVRDLRACGHRVRRVNRRAMVGLPTRCPRSLPFRTMLSSIDAGGTGCRSNLHALSARAMPRVRPACKRRVPREWPDLTVTISGRAAGHRNGLGRHFEQRNCRAYADVLRTCHLADPRTSSVA
jgi:hypothetical protein